MLTSSWTGSQFRLVASEKKRLKKNVDGAILTSCRRLKCEAIPWNIKKNSNLKKSDVNEFIQKNLFNWFSTRQVLFDIFVLRFWTILKKKQTNTILKLDVRPNQAYPNFIYEIREKKVWKLVKLKIQLAISCNRYISINSLFL